MTRLTPPTTVGSRATTPVAHSPVIIALTAETRPWGGRDLALRNVACERPSPQA